MLGGIAGAALLEVTLGSYTTLGANGYGGSLMNGTEVRLWIALLVEVILTFIFVLTILGITKDKNNSAVSGIVIGLTLTLVHLFGLFFTGTSVNPVRSFAALLQGGEALSQVWIFILAPIIGGILAALFYRFIIQTKK